MPHTEPLTSIESIFGLPTALLWPLFSIVVAAWILTCYSLYNAFLHPLRAYPGPMLWAASRLPWFYNTTRGRIHVRILELHKKYGPVVRIAPNELSYTAGGAWQEIYGHRSVEMMKDLQGGGILPSFSGTPSIINAVKADHSRMRRAIAPAFSEKALREQEHILQQYVDQMIARLSDVREHGPVDIVSWYNWCTFDMLGDLSFGESFGCLEQGGYHTWVGLIFQSVKGYPWFQALIYYHLVFLAGFLTPKSLADAKKNADAYAFSKVERRLDRKDFNRKDFMTYILAKDGDKAMSKPEIQETAAILIIAGSETTATLLSGVTYFMLKHPHIYERVVTEIRTLFKSYMDITQVTTNELKYLPAVIDETFRIYPPSPASFPRIVPGHGEKIQGVFVPGGTRVGVPQFAANRDPRNFYRPDDFLPERWQNDCTRIESDVPSGMFTGDQKSVVQPFSVGPRNCIGKALAYVEMRIILAKVLWSFDLRLAPGETMKRWDDQNVYMLWEKEPLMVDLIPVRRRNLTSLERFC